MFELNATLPIFIMMFLVFMNLLDRMVLRPMGAKIELRQRKIDDDLESGKAARAKASELVAAHEKQIHQARVQAQAMVNEAQGRAQQDRQKQLKELAAKGQAQLQAAKQNFAKERQNLIGQLAAEEQALVSTIMKKLLGDAAAVSIDANTARAVLAEEAS